MGGAPVTASRMEPHALAQILGVDLTQATTTTRPTSAAAAEIEPFDLSNYPLVRAALDNDTADRSVDTMRVVGACKDSGLTLGQTRWAVRTRTDLAQRLDSRRDDDVQACWDKIDAQIEDVTEATENVTHSAHLGMAIKMGKQFNGKLINVNKIGWHVWNGKCYAPDGNGAARRAVHSVIKRDRKIVKSLELPSEEEEKRLKQIARYETASAITGILTEAAALEVFSVEVNDLDADPYLYNCANGTFDLRTMELRPHNPADRITKVARGAWRPDTKSALWDNFLARTHPDEEVRGFLQRHVGAGLLGEVREHVLAIWTGKGANGKSVTDRTIRYALGDYALTAEPDLFMHRQGAHPTGEMDLLGARWVSVSESEEDRRLAEATVKRLTGGDTIRARRMRQDFIQFEPSHTAVLITNHLPKVRGDDDALWRRLRVIPFSVVIPEKERDGALGGRLQLEADAVLSWAIEGWRQYKAIGLAEPDAVRVATDKYHSDSDAIARFIAEECVTSSPALKATTAGLHLGWEQWRTRDGAEPMSMKAFGQALDRHGYPAGSPSSGKRWRVGIALKAVEDDD